MNISIITFLIGIFFHYPMSVYFGELDYAVQVGYYKMLVHLIFPMGILSVMAIRFRQVLYLFIGGGICLVLYLIIAGNQGDGVSIAEEWTFVILGVSFSIMSIFFSKIIFKLFEGNLVVNELKLYKLKKEKEKLLQEIDESFEKEKEQSELIKLLIDSTDASFILIDENDRVKAFNQRFVSKVKYYFDLEAELDVEVINYIPGHVMEMWHGKLQELHFEKEVNFVSEVQGIHKKYHLDINIQKITGDQNNGRGMKAIRIFDISNTVEKDRKLQEQNKELKTINEALDKFTYSVSHDLKGPILSLDRMIDLMREEKDQNMMDTYFDMQKRSLKSMHTFVSDLLLYSKNRSTVVIIEDINLYELVSSIYLQNAFLQEYEALQFELNIDQNALIKADKQRLLAVLNNLISNAVKYGNYRKMDPFVRVSLIEDDQYSIIEVEDNGYGIPEEELPRIFDMFFKGSQRTDSSGIGLFIVKEAVEAMKGQISVTSSINVGTKFIIKLQNQ